MNRCFVRFCISLASAALFAVHASGSQTPGGEYVQDTQGGLASGFADKIASLADIDGDGVADLVAYEPNFGNGYCEILLSAGASVRVRVRARGAHEEVPLGKSAARHLSGNEQT